MSLPVSGRNYDGTIPATHRLGRAKGLRDSHEGPSRWLLLCLRAHAKHKILSSRRHPDARRGCISSVSAARAAMVFSSIALATGLASTATMPASL